MQQSASQLRTCPLTADCKKQTKTVRFKSSCLEKDETQAYMLYSMDKQLAETSFCMRNNTLDTTNCRILEQTQEVC
jgi:hypothetical protein